MRKYFGVHNHTHYSNLRLLDCINRPEKLIQTAKELGLSGVAITDHECLSSHVIFNKIMQEEKDFKIALGNEIYLTNNRDSGQKYYHFILIAKDAEGHKQLRELSSTAWHNSYVDRKLERVPTLKSELKSIIGNNKGHLIATTACIGGELSSNALLFARAKQIGDMNNAQVYYKSICNFIDFCLDIFGEDFYIECAPSDMEDQIIVNKQLRGIANKYNIKMVVGTDAHYLRPEDKPIHKAYITSKEGDRETDDFYKYTYLMNSDEVSELLNYSFDNDFIEDILDNTLEVDDKITSYSLFHKQDIPKVEVKEYPIPVSKMGDYMENNFPILCGMTRSRDVQDRYWVNECLNKLNELGKYNKEYLTELEEEARVKKVISEKLETNMFRYPNTLQHYIDLIWSCGSMVGAGRGSSCAALNHYLMGITQLDPIEWNLPFFRYMNDERVELGSLILILPSCK